MCYVLSLNRERAEAVTHVMHTHKRSVGISLQRFLHYRLVHITLIHQCERPTCCYTMVKMKLDERYEFTPHLTTEIKLVAEQHGQGQGRGQHSASWAQRRLEDLIHTVL